MAKGSKPSMPKAPSKAQIAKDDRHYTAVSMVRDAMCNTPRFQKAVRTAERELANVDSTVKGIVTKAVKPK